MQTTDRGDDGEPGDRRTDVTRALRRELDGSEAAKAEVSAAIYCDIHRMAEGLLRRERSDHTLQATALVHEAWLRLVDETSLNAQESTIIRRKFVAHAVQAMRRVLIDHARARSAEKRGDPKRRVAFTESMALSVGDAHELLDLDEALRKLAVRKPRAARIAAMRIFGGLSNAEAAAAIEISLATAKADWALAKARLTSWLRGRNAAGESRSDR